MREIRHRHSEPKGMIELLHISFSSVPDPGHHVEKVDFEKLETAQMKKIDSLIDMLDLKESDRVLEIGCGWGAFAIRGVQVSDGVCHVPRSGF